MGRPLYAGLKTCTQLEAPKHRICLIPRLPHYNIDDGTAEHIQYPYRAYPWALIQWNGVTCYQRTVSGPGWGEFSTQSSVSATTTLNSSDAHSKRRSQFLSSTASAPSAPAVPESLDATHMTLYSEKSRGTVSRNSLYYSKAMHVGFSTGGTRMSGCLSRRTSTTGCPVFVQTPPRRRPPFPTLCRFPSGPPAADFQTARCCGSCATGDTPSPHRLL